MRIKHYLLLLLLSFALASQAQTNEIKEMRRRVGTLQKQIAQKENILLSSKQNINAKLKNLDILTARIKERKELIALLTKEVAALNREITTLNKDVAEKEHNVAVSKDEYAAALRRARNYGSFRTKLLFIISADDFNSMVRRYRYAGDYMRAYKKKGEELGVAINELQERKAVLDSTLQIKNSSLADQQQQRKSMQELEEQQRTLVKELRRDAGKVEKELKAQRAQLQKLNAEIDRAIDREIEAQKAREREAAKKKAEKQPQKGKKPTAKPAAKEDEGVRKMSGSFLQNKGKLPVPISGPYHIVGTFGPQKGVAGKGSVQIDYGGVTFGGERGAKARCVFDGKVTSVIRQGQFAFVLVRHGKYITVYCRLGDIAVKEGDTVKAGDTIGTVATDADGHTRLLFQLRNEKTKLDPMQWIRVQ